MKEINAPLTAAPLGIAIVAGRFNDLVTGRLIEGARDCFVRHGGDDSRLCLVRVPGAFEIPLVAGKLAQSGRYQAVLTLGAVIRGSTPHFDHVANAASKGTASESLKSGVPIIFGVLTCDTLEQALERAGVKAGNKGWDTMLAAIEMANLMEMIKD
jgi:6,7-dimethyl-8-ribityllumazine synthase